MLKDLFEDFWSVEFPSSYRGLSLHYFPFIRVGSGQRAVGGFIRAGSWQRAVGGLIRAGRRFRARGHT